MKEQGLTTATTRWPAISRRRWDQRRRRRHQHVHHD